MTTWARQIYEHDPLAIAKGEVNGYSSEHKFGAVPAMSQNQTGTIWDVNDTNYPWSSWSTAGTVDIPAVNAADNGKKITLVGLDADYNAQSEEITLSSSGSVTSTNSYIRLYRAFISEGISNVGVINVQKSSVTVLRINAGKGQTLMAIYTVPKNHTAFLTKGVMTVQASADATGDMFVRYFQQETFRVGHSFEVSGAGGPYMYDFTIPLKIPEKTDIAYDYAVHWYEIAVVLGWTALFIFLSYRLLKKRDL